MYRTDFLAARASSQAALPNTLSGRLGAGPYQCWHFYMPDGGGDVTPRAKRLSRCRQLTFPRPCVYLRSSTPKLTGMLLRESVSVFFGVGGSRADSCSPPSDFRYKV